MKNSFKLYTRNIIFSVMVLLLLGIVSADTRDSALVTTSLINQDPDPAIAGDIVEIRLGVGNQGGESSGNVILEIVPEYPFSILPGDTGLIEVGTIGAYDYDEDVKVVKFKLRIDRDATAGEYEFKIKQYEEGEENIASTKSITIDIENKESAEVIYIDQVELIPGKITPMRFTVNNVGSAPLRELTFQWENEEDIILPVGSDNTKYIKYIDIGDSAEMEFQVIASANADPDLYKLDLTLTYDDPLTSEEKEINTKAGIYVGGATDFDAAFSGNSDGEYSFAISNIGSVSASSVTVKVPDQEGWKVSGSNSVIIGNLNEGDYTIASFKLQKTGQNAFGSGQTTTRDAKNTDKIAVKSAMPDDTPIKLEILYTDSRGNRNMIEKEVFIDSSSTLTGMIGTGSAGFAGRGRQKQSVWSQLWAKGKWVLLGLIILAMLIVVRRKYKKEKIENSDYSYLTAVKDILKIHKSLFKFKKNKK